MPNLRMSSMSRHELSVIIEFKLNVSTDKNGGFFRVEFIW